MSIIETITDSSYFYHWLQKSDNYKNNFSYEGANALQAFLDNLSDELDENLEFDPIAWCCEYSEYENIEDFNEQHGTDHESKEDLEQFTSVIDLDGDGFIIADF